MVWFVIAAVIAAAVGPLLWLLPSRRQRQLGKWRNAARGQGLVVELTSVELTDAPPEERVTTGGVARSGQRQCVAYRLPLLPPRDDAPRWRLLKSASGSLELPGWQLATAPRQPSPPAADYWRRLHPLLDALPGGCIGVEATARAISWLGLETAEEGAIGTTVADIKAGLADIAALQREQTPASQP